MQIRVLGPLQMEQNGISITPSAHKLRQALALFLLNANRCVSTSELIEELWENDPPRSAMATLQTYILRLRKTLGDELVLTGPGGYTLLLDEGVLDLHRFERHIERARAELDRNACANAADLLDRAARLWRGQPLSDLSPGPILRREIVRLEECHLNVLEQRFEIKISLRRYSENVSELRDLCMRYRMHEILHAQLMLCLYHCGRRPEALTVYEQVRRTLADELALEPSMRLQELHDAMLANDPDPEPTLTMAGPPPGCTG
ncbi:AfsR/SARP family transcriptional regulator [Actinomadura rubrisoli]|uniref:OmpR/PhoB-type domain-containing protein n=1 Tax=Actinomadura rubrisoli TaxID=2530368 RepID=A0A4R4ZZL3_9ACTN|nr:AfsR/SARP family transcriptional regulator [Actinomadura rubrisoli]TDD62622.1 hypothetical protein E1298_44475 [Actinomadura rubrisoli]